MNRKVSQCIDYPPPQANSSLIEHAQPNLSKENDVDSQYQTSMKPQIAKSLTHPNQVLRKEEDRICQLSIKAYN